MELNRVLYATDFSSASEPALGFASKLASESHATLYIAYVETAREAPLPYAAEYGYYAEHAAEAVAAMKRHREQLDEVRPASPGANCVHRLLEGDPAEQILNLANEVGADVIVVGSHGRTGFSRVLLGSVAEEIVRRAECPVVVVKHPGKLTEADDAGADAPG